MVQMQGLTLQELQDLYDASSDEVKKWMLENGKVCREEATRP